MKEFTLTRKQDRILRELNQRDWFMLINHGAKRSGKTFLDNLLFLSELSRVSQNAKEDGIENPQYILAGFTLGNINDNVLNELRNLGIEFKFDRYNNFELLGVKVVQTSTGNISGIGRIRGMTAYGAYINEASLCHPEVFDEIKARCSGRGARIICDTNPDSPEHWLLKDYIQNEKAEGIVSYHFALDDNELLDPRYVRETKATTPRGMFYDRAIKGLWVSGEGAIYSMFDKESMAVSREEAYQGPYERLFVGVDWGFRHKTVFTVCGYRSGAYTLIEEHAASGKDIGHWISVAQDIQSYFGRRIPFYCDTENPEHIHSLQSHGVNARAANKAVINGIEYLSTLMHNGLFYVNYESCPQFREEIYKYAWNSKTGDVLKQYDDCMDSLRYAVYSDYIANRRGGSSLDELASLRKFL